MDLILHTLNFKTHNLIIFQFKVNFIVMWEHNLKIRCRYQLNLFSLTELGVSVCLSVCVCVFVFNVVCFLFGCKNALVLLTHCAHLVLIIYSLAIGFLIIFQAK